jgi:hypothetical protein
MMLHQWLGGPSKYLSSETAPHPEDQNPCLAMLITETYASVQLDVVRTVQDTARQQGTNKGIYNGTMFNYKYYFGYRNIVFLDINE